MLRGSMWRMIRLHKPPIRAGLPTGVALLPLATPASVSPQRLAVALALGGGMVLGSVIATPVDAMMKRAREEGGDNPDKRRRAAAEPPQRIFTDLGQDEEARALKLFADTRTIYNELASLQLTHGQPGKHAVEALRHAHFVALLAKAQMMPGALDCATEMMQWLVVVCGQDPGSARTLSSTSIPWLGALRYPSVKTDKQGRRIPMGTRTRLADTTLTQALADHDRDHRLGADGISVRAADC